MVSEVPSAVTARIYFLFRILEAAAWLWYIYKEEMKKGSQQQHLLAGFTSYHLPNREIDGPPSFPQEGTKPSTTIPRSLVQPGRAPHSPEGTGSWITCSAYKPTTCHSKGRTGGTGTRGVWAGRVMCVCGYCGGWCCTGDVSGVCVVES